MLQKIDLIDSSLLQAVFQPELNQNGRKSRKKEGKNTKLIPCNNENAPRKREETREGRNNQHCRFHNKRIRRLRLFRGVTVDGNEVCFAW